jgi:hypothetical protein
VTARTKRTQPLKEVLVRNGEAVNVVSIKRPVAHLALPPSSIFAVCPWYETGEAARNFFVIDSVAGIMHFQARD